MGTICMKSFWICYKGICLYSRLKMNYGAKIYRFVCLFVLIISFLIKINMRRHSRMLSSLYCICGCLRHLSLHLSVSFWYMTVFRKHNIKLSDLQRLYRYWICRKRECSLFHLLYLIVDLLWWPFLIVCLFVCFNIFLINQNSLSVNFRSTMVWLYSFIYIII